MHRFILSYYDTHYSDYGGKRDRCILLLWFHNPTPNRNDNCYDNSLTNPNVYLPIQRYLLLIDNLVVEIAVVGNTLVRTMIAGMCAPEIIFEKPSNTLAYHDMKRDMTVQSATITDPA